MIITNKFKLPEPIVQAVQSDYEYKDKRYSVTTLLKPIREIMLLRRYSDRCVVDVSDLIWSLFGTAVHSILENSTHTEHLIQEQKVEIKIGEYTLSGRYDLYNTQEQSVIDYKVTSTYKVVKQEFEDYKQQGLMYVYMLRQLGYKPRSAKFILFLRDWQSTKAKFDKKYPQSQVYVKEFKFTDKDYKFIENWLTNKFKEIAEAEKLEDDNLPLCSEQERWSSGNTYAVMKNGRKTALRVLQTKEEAETYMKEKGGDFIDERHGEDRRCQDYCQCCEFCPYYLQNYSNGKDGGLPF